MSLSVQISMNVKIPCGVEEALMEWVVENSASTPLGVIFALDFQTWVGRELLSPLSGYFNSGYIVKFVSHMGWELMFIEAFKTIKCLICSWKPSIGIHFDCLVVTLVLDCV